MAAACEKSNLEKPEVENSQDESFAANLACSEAGRNHLR